MLSDRRIKILATLGPSSIDESVIQGLIENGVNICRLNFSHGTHDQHLDVINKIRKISKKLKAPVGILQDLQGPKIRVNQLEGGELLLSKGMRIRIEADQDKEGNTECIYVDYLDIVESGFVGQKIFFDDGLMGVIVVEKKTSYLIVEVINGGVLKPRKGVNLPGARITLDSLTPKDLIDLEFGLKHKVDYIAHSFVKTAQDMTNLKSKIAKANSSARVIAKIELSQAIENLEEIINNSDGVMVARGDLAIEVGQIHLPRLQKRIIKLSNEIGRPVIVATQMLDSMVKNPRPTRAEITDVATAVIDGADAIMLSAETASGKHPVKCVETMHEISLEVEKSAEKYYTLSLDEDFFSIPQSIAASACLSALKLNAQIIVCLTTTGKTARMISKYRPKAKIVAMTKIESTLNKLELSWGIQTLSVDEYNSVEEAVKSVENKLLINGIGKPGDRVLLTLGVPVNTRSKTNTLQAFVINDEAQKRLSEKELPQRCKKKLS